MKKSKYSEEQIATALRHVEAGAPVAEVTRKLGISSKLRVVLVYHCLRENDLVVRIISARKTDQSEERDYCEARQ